jgi:hypothetical protein
MKDTKYNIGYLIETIADVTVDPVTGEVIATIVPQLNDDLVVPDGSGTTSVNYTIFNSGNIGSNITSNPKLINERVLDADGINYVNNAIIYYESVFGNIFNPSSYNDSKIAFGRVKRCRRDYFLNSCEVVL